MKTPVFVALFLILQCVSIRTTIEEPVYSPKKNNQNLKYSYELINWKTGDKSEAARFLLEWIQKYSENKFEYRVENEKKNHLRIILEEYPGNRLLTSNFIEKPVHGMLRILNRILFVSTLSVFPLIRHPEREITFLYTNSLMEEKSITIQSEYRVFFGLGALLALPWYEKEFLQKEMKRVAIDFLNQADL
ncbi:MAG: hypothetical protein K8R21_01145 [Leptospira sp.]|nr:hypothetical protein [Leptospira sp.]